MESTAESTKLADLAHRAHKLLDDSQLTGRILDIAEEAVNSLDEMRKLVAAVNELAGDDAKRVERVQGKLEQREASQARYVHFQDQEKTASRASEFIQLAEQVVAELEDKFYAAKLLGNAEELSERLYREAADKCMNAEHFVQLAHRLRTHGLPVERQRELFALGEQKLTEPRMRLRWAEGIIQLFDDRAWAAQVYAALEDQFPDDEWGKNRLTHSRRYWLESGHKVWG